MGVLNDITKSHLEVHDARLARIHMPTKLVDHFEVVRLVKTHIFAMCAARREDLGPSSLVRGAYTNTAPLPARLTSNVYEIEGKLEVAGRFDFVSLVSDRTRNFVPIFDATLTAILIPTLRWKARAYCSTASRSTWWPSSTSAQKTKNRKTLDHCRVR
jgi:hypothetical protein